MIFGSVLKLPLFMSCSGAVITHMIIKLTLLEGGKGTIERKSNLFAPFENSVQHY